MKGSDLFIKCLEAEGVEYIFSAHYGMSTDFETAMESWK